MQRRHLVVSLSVAIAAIPAAPAQTPGAGLEPRITTPAWAQPKQVPGARQVHVSLIGNDRYGDGSIDAPYATIRRGWQAVRDDSSDWLLLERGGTWTAELTVDKGGIDASRPLVIGTFGSGPRPIIQHDNGPIATRHNNDQSYVTVTGVRLQPRGWFPGDPIISGSALQISAGTCDSWVIEDCYIAGFNNGLTINSPSRVQRPVIRGCVFRGNFTHLFLRGVNDGLVEYCYFHTHGQFSTPHMIYNQFGNQRLVIRRNAFGMNPYIASSVIEQRSHRTTIEDNYFFKCSAAIWCGSYSTASQPDAGGQVDIAIERNVFDAMAGTDDVHLAHIANGTFRHNLDVHRTGSTGSCLGLTRGNRSSVPPMTGVHNLLIDDWVVHSTTGGDAIRVSTPDHSNIRIRRCSVDVAQYVLSASSAPASLFTSSDNVWRSRQTGHFYLGAAPPPGPVYVSSEYAAFRSRIRDPSGGNASILRRPSFTDRSRSGATYVDHVEARRGSTYSDLADRLLSQSKAAWNPSYSAPRINGWIQTGFDVLQRSDG